ncbi:GumC family protein [Galbibacter mesophilus]|uniref:GumC family protein n=1 Tax=Galbibacter mesophilus TaxID=379069 RepID=UPI00191FFC32|nr:polysaccharide biosynthesis tyrosine autokinase [Galbibacter mesophilus]MCM5663436.1 polysaccharide biosynthesis tyrosine autokinase [Galbibacter mesophilus]
MTKDMDNNERIDGQAPKINFKEIIAPYLKNWYWFVLSLLIMVSLAYAYVRYSKPMYAANATILIADEANMSPEAAILEGLSENSYSDKKIEGEIQILKSRELMLEVVESLGLTTQLYSKGRINNTEIYRNKPFTVNYLNNDSIIEKAYLKFSIKILSEESFEFSRNESIPKAYMFGENVPTSLGNIILLPNLTNIKGYVGQTIEVVKEPLSQVGSRYKNRLVVSNVGKGSNIISIHLTDLVQEKATDLVNTIISTYNKNSIKEKNMVAEATANFIDDRIALMASDLSDVDRTKERFKVGNRLTDITSEAGLFLESGATNEQNLIQLQTELNTVNYMSNYLSRKDSYEALPSNLGLMDESIGKVITQYNELVIKRKALLKTSGQNNPVVVELDHQLDGLKATLGHSLDNVKNTISIKSSNLRAQEELINNRISAVPGQERQNRDIQRQQNIKETIYLYLLQKREESAISMAATPPVSKVIEPAYNSYNVVSSAKKVYFGSVLLGLLLPFGFIYLRNLLDTKIHKKTDITEALPTIPVLAQLPRIENKKALAIQENDRSVLAESFRILRTNIDYLFKKTDKQRGKVVYVTSSISGEGKTFISYNLATVYAHSNKNVLLIGADIRKPSLTDFIANTSSVGLSEYLHGDAELDEIIKPVLSFNSLDIIQSGKIPPNPAELLMDERLKTLFDTVKQNYDVIIVDTAPSMPVTDTILIGEFADRTIYVTRADYTEKSLLKFVSEVYREGKLKNVSLLINDVKTTNLGYGAKMGYGYGATAVKKKRWAIA